jgi:hypothetical protein
MKTPTAEPTPPKRAFSHDASIWLTVLLATFLLVKLGIVISRHV